MSAPFRQRGALRQWELRFGPNMTPMVDIVMVILIFFMAGTTIVGPEWFLRAAIPAPPVPAGGEPAGGDPFELPPAQFEIRLAVRPGPPAVTVATGLGLEGADLASLEERIGRLAREAPAGELIVLIGAGADVPYRDVVRVRDACERAGIGRVGLVEAGG